MLASAPLMWSLKNWKLKTDKLGGLRQQSPGKEGKRMEEWRDWGSMTEADKFKTIFRILVKREGADRFEN